MEKYENYCNNVDGRCHGYGHLAQHTYSAEFARFSWLRELRIPWDSGGSLNFRNRNFGWIMTKMIGLNGVLVRAYTFGRMIEPKFDNRSQKPQHLCASLVIWYYFPRDFFVRHESGWQWWSEGDNERTNPVKMISSSSRANGHWKLDRNYWFVFESSLTHSVASTRTTRLQSTTR